MSTYIGRTSTCAVCGDQFPSPVAAVSHPRFCVVHRDLHSAVDHLLERVAELTDVIEQSPNNARYIPGCDRTELGRAVRRFLDSSGVKPSIAALEHLRDVAGSFALRLGGRPDIRDAIDQSAANEEDLHAA